MDRACLDLLACPLCEGVLSPDLHCQACGHIYAAPEGIADLRLPGNARTETVRQFYSEAPFPGYPPQATADWLRARAGRSAFAKMLDQAIAPDARVVEIGCGTGQMSLFLAGGERTVIGADLTRASLRLGLQAAHRFGCENVGFVETDLLRPGLRREAFDVVYCAGVLHHTPDPREAFASVARLVRPGGILVVGLYHRLARLPTRLRGIVRRWSGQRMALADPVLRERGGQADRYRAWERDQYHHPEEHSHGLGEVRGWFRDHGLGYLRAYPSALLDREGEDDDLFTPQADDWAIESALAELSWIWRLGSDGGLFIVVGCKPWPD